MTGPPGGPGFHRPGCVAVVVGVYQRMSSSVRLCAFISAAASSFSFCRPAVEYRALTEDFKHQLSRRTGGNLTWHDGRGQKTAGSRAVKLLQQPGTEALQVPVLHFCFIFSALTATAPPPPYVNKPPRSDWLVSAHV